jgi:HSP20 family molecular chaperone IbpA
MKTTSRKAPVHRGQEHKMTNVLAAQRYLRSFLAELPALFTSFPSWAGLRPMFDSHLLRMEDERADGHYVMRAEIPGIDPAKDIDVTVRDGRLTMEAERGQKTQSDGHSEFSHGSFIRSVTLPAGADENTIKATYDKGIPTVSVSVSKSTSADKHVTDVRTASYPISYSEARQ